MGGRQDRSTREGFVGVRDPAPAHQSPSLAPSGDWQAALPMRCGSSWGWWWDRTDGGRHGKPHVLFHLLHLIDFPQKEKKNKPVAWMKLLIKRPSD